jgi:hypothetical protein
MNYWQMLERAERDGRPFLTPARLARDLGVNRSTVWRWAQRGLAEVVRNGPRTGVRMRLRALEPRGRR